MTMLVSVLLLVSLLADVITAQPPLKIVHIGDSMSAGNGARDSDGHRNYVGPDGCSRSPTNWGSQYANSLKDDYSVTYINRACGGALLPEMMAAPREDKKRGRCPRKSKWNDGEYFEQKSLLCCTQYLVPQVEHVDNTTDLVLLTIGGNDAGFPDLVQRCLLALAPKDAKNCQEALEYGYKQGPVVTEGLKEVIVDLFSRMDGGGKVVVFQYPNIVADIPQFVSDKGRRFDNDVGPLVLDAAFGVRDLTQFGNAALVTAVEEANVELGTEFAMIYNKTQALFAGHEPHPGLLKLNKDGWFWEFNTRKIGEFFHPNPEGQKQWGAAVAKEGIFGLDLGGTMRQRELANIGLSAWAGDEYAGFVGEPILFDASGSYDDSGLELISFEWDFNNDGIFDMTTKSATVFFVYEGSYFGRMSVRVTNEEGQVATDWGTVHVRGKTLAESS